MPWAARREIVAEGEVGAYHCMARCVRRAYLCGKDSLTGKSFEHRKDWVRQSLERLAGAFAIDVAGFSIMDNHLHVILKQRPDIAKTWSAADVTTRWRAIFGKAPKSKSERDLLQVRIEIEAQDSKLVKLRRDRLSSVSWFMRCLCEPIARRANKEDGCTGRFWEGRFRSQALLDDAAMLACSAYVDLNPVRAKIATTPERSRHTSIYERICERQKPSTRTDESRDGWLSPLGKPARSQKAPARRASNDVALELDLDAYLSLLDWTGRQIRHKSNEPDSKERQSRAGQIIPKMAKGAIPDHLSPILDRLKIQPDGWVEVVTNFGRWFKHAAGSPDRLAKLASRRKVRSLKGIGPSRAFFS